jgi:hypothetical protein
VKIDGGYHADARRQRADVRRAKRLERAGYRVLRLSAELVLGNLPSSRAGTGGARHLSATSLPANMT